MGETRRTDIEDPKEITNNDYNEQNIVNPSGIERDLRIRYEKRNIVE